MVLESTEPYTCMQVVLHCNSCSYSVLPPHLSERGRPRFPAMVNFEDVGFADHQGRCMHSFFDNGITRYKTNRNVLDWMVDANIVSPHIITGTFAQTSNARASSPSAILCQSLSRVN